MDGNDFWSVQPEKSAFNSISSSHGNRAFQSWKISHVVPPALKVKHCIFYLETKVDQFCNFVNKSLQNILQKCCGEFSGFEFELLDGVNNRFIFIFSIFTEIQSLILKMK